ncbi:uracil-DNA glycosylase-like [Oppia nitens]|uniref:uracil-DNA glycosylase-like n=1 Tax=Oppia nitens TaxID=1686743 RepID=UPI0023DC2A27|nr:uracil-DNA glycosylase-like [Oppia nitens]
MLKCLFISSRNMSQRSITSYFKTNQIIKRKLSETNDNTDDGANHMTKQQKIAKEADGKQSILSLTKCDIRDIIIKQSVVTPALSTNIGHTWFRALKPEFSKDYFIKLSQFLELERKRETIYPSIDEVFSWTTMTDISQTKVVILGQDPYHGPNQAHGLAFSVRKGVPPPPSLKNMFKEIENDIQVFNKPKHGDLTGWAKQGVLLLNACLTVRAHKANSHSEKGWEKLTDAVIKWLDENQSSLVFILWGSYAHKKGNFINKKKHLVLQTVHPSPLSAHRGFFGCKHFSQTNDYLKNNSKKPIDWNYLP